MKIKHILMTILLAAAPLAMTAQGTATTKRTTEFAEFKPALVLTANGQRLTVPEANILLKRSSLIYLSQGRRTMEAATANIRAVDFSDRHYERIDSLLAWRVDSVGDNALYCVTRIDIEALKNNIINNRQMTDLQLNSLLLDVTTVGPNDSDLVYPLVNIYYFKLKGKFVRCHERELYRHVPKDRRHDYEVALSMPNFSWTSRQSLMDVLRSITTGPKN
jgi:hypothetical protein